MKFEKPEGKNIPERVQQQESQKNVVEPTNAERFAVRLMQDELRSYEAQWSEYDPKGAKNDVETLRATLEKGDYTLVLGQLLHEKSILLKDRESGKSDAHLEDRVREIDRIIKPLGAKEFSGAGAVTEEDAGMYLDLRASELAQWAREGHKSGGNMEDFKRDMEEAELYRQLAAQIYEASSPENNAPLSPENKSKIIEILQKEMEYKSRVAGSSYANVFTGEGGLDAYLKPTEGTKFTTENLKTDIDQAIRVGALAELFSRQAQKDRADGGKQQELERLRREINGGSESASLRDEEDGRLRESKNKIDSFSINRGGASRRLETVPVNEQKIEPRRLTPTEFEETFGRLFERSNGQTKARTNVLEMPISEEEKEAFTEHVLGKIEGIKNDLRKIQQRNPRVRANSNVASVLGNGGVEVGMLQIFLAKKEGRIRNAEDVLRLDPRVALKEATGYEINDPEWDNFFAK